MRALTEYNRRSAVFGRVGRHPYLVQENGRVATDSQYATLRKRTRLTLEQQVVIALRHLRFMRLVGIFGACDSELEPEG